MARRPRLYHPGGVYHVFSRGNNRATIFHDPDAYRAFWQRVGLVTTRTGWRLHAIALMPTHLHLVLQTIQVSLSTGLHALLGWYAQWVNRHLGRSGHLFQGRFGHRLCDRDSYLLQLIRYVHLNPVRAGLVSSVDDWEWSSHHEYVGRRDTPWVDSASILEMFGDAATARSRYVTFLADRAGAEVFEKKLLKMPVLGDEPFIEQAKAGKGLPVRQAVRPVWKGAPLEEIAAVAARVSGLSVDEMRRPGKRRQESWARQAFAYIAVRHAHHTVTAVARYLGRTQSSISIGISAIEQDVGRESRTKAILDALEAGPPPNSIFNA